MEQPNPEARKRRDHFLDVQRRANVVTTSDPMWDIYMAALEGLDRVFAKEPGAAASLAYVVRRIEQYNLSQVEQEPKGSEQAFRELREVIADA
jgi:hypothetical protein